MSTQDKEKQDLSNKLEGLRNQWKNLFESKNLTEELGNKLLEVQYELEDASVNAKTMKIEKLRNKILSLNSKLTVIQNEITPNLKGKLMSVLNPKLILRVRYLPVTLFGFLLATGIFVNPAFLLFALTLVVGIGMDSVFKFTPKPVTAIQMFSSLYLLLYEGISLSTGETIVAVETLISGNVMFNIMQTALGGIWALVASLGVGFPVVIFFGIMYMSKNSCKNSSVCAPKYSLEGDEGKHKVRSSLYTFLIMFAVMSYLTAFVASYELFGDLLGAAIGSIILWAFYLPIYIIPIGIGYALGSLYFAKTQRVLFSAPTKL